MKKFMVIFGALFLSILLVLLSVLAGPSIWVSVISIVAFVIWTAVAIPFYRSLSIPRYTQQPFKNTSPKPPNQPYIGKVVEKAVPQPTQIFPTKIVYDLQMVQAFRDYVEMLELESGSTSDINPNRFKMTGNHVFEVYLEVRPCSAEDSVEELAKKLQSEGFFLQGTIELKSFLDQYPEEVKKWGFVLAIHEDARWINPSNHAILLPCISVHNKIHKLGLAYSLEDGRKIGVKKGGILVSRRGKMVIRQ